MVGDSQDPPPAGQPPAAPFPSRRLVLLGASNVARGIATILETAALAWGRPLEVLAAFGHGRSYGQHSTILGRTLPGITQCGLWAALAGRAPLPTAALLTDVGNDLFFGAPVERIAGWVEECLDRLAAVEARVVMTRMPVGNLRTVAPWQYLAMRTLFFPRCRLSLDELGRSALQLDERLCRLARQRGVCLVEQRPEWYGLDPIHIKFNCSPRAWCDIMGDWSQQAEFGQAAPSTAQWLYLKLLVPQQRWWFGIPQRQVQPSGRLPDGSTIWLY